MNTERRFYPEWGDGEITAVSKETKSSMDSIILTVKLKSALQGSAAEEAIMDKISEIGKRLDKIYSKQGIPQMEEAVSYEEQIYNTSQEAGYSTVPDIIEQSGAAVLSLGQEGVAVQTGAETAGAAGLPVIGVEAGSAQQKNYSNYIKQLQVVTEC